MPRHFPALNEALRRDYQQLVGEIDLQMTELARTRFGPRLRCRPGCSSCCLSFSVLPLEAAIIAEASMAENVPISKPSDNRHCCFLDDDCCRIYPARPIICRTQGLPVAYIDEAAERIEVSACPLNFPDDYPLNHEDLLFLDPFNKQLVTYNRRYCRKAGLEPTVRIPIKTLGTPTS